MQLFIVAVGKARGSAEHRLAENWLGRLPEGGGELLLLGERRPAVRVERVLRGALVLAQRARAAVRALAVVDELPQPHAERLLRSDS